MARRMYFDAWANGDYNGTSLGELTDAFDKNIRKAHNAIGHGQFTINRHSSQFDWCEPDNLIRVRLESGGPFDPDDSRYVYAFIIEEGEDELISTDEEGGEDVVRQGRDAVPVILKRAIIWPTHSHADNEIYWERALRDGVVRFTAANFAQGGRSVGSVLRTFIRDAEARSPSPLEGMDDDFSYGLDSSGDSWTETDTDWEFPVGLNYLELLGNLTSSGLHWDSTAALILRAWDTDQGVDRSATITFAKADDISWIAKRSIAAREAVSDVVVKGSSTNDQLKYRTITDSGMRTELDGRREAFVEYQSTPTNARLDLAGQRYIDAAADARDGPTSLTAPEAEGVEAFTDYFAGDTVTVDIPGVWDELPTRISAIALQDIENGEFDPTLEFFEQPWDGMGGERSGAEGCRGCPPLEPYVPNPHETGTTCDATGVAYTPSGTYAAPGSLTSADGYNLYWKAGHAVPEVPTPGYVGSWNFPDFGGAGDGHVSGLNFWRIPIRGPGTLTVKTIAGNRGGGGTTAATSYIAKVWHRNASGPDTLEGTYAGTPGVDLLIPLAQDAAHECTHYVEMQTPGGSQNMLANGFVWALGTTVYVNPPIPGQQGNEGIAGTTAGTTYTTNYPYQPGSLQVWVCGTAIVPTETDPSAGEFTLPVNATGCDVVVRYVIASSTGTGESNPPPTPGPSTLPVNFAWFNVMDYGATGDGSTDDTDAIQATINAAVAAGGGVIYFPPGIYVIDGALQDTGAFNGQLLLPNVDHADPHMVLTFRGALRPGLHPVYGNDPPPDSVATLRTTLTGGTGTAAVFSGGNNLDAPHLGGGNNLAVNVEDLICEAPPDPSLTFWNLSACQGGAFKDVQLSITGDGVEPTNSNAYGVKLPQVYFSNYTRTEGLSIAGYYTCLLNGELAMHHGLVGGVCIVFVEQPEMFYPSVIFDMTVTSFQYGVKFTGGDSRLDILSYTAEHTTSPAWMVTVADIDDPSNYGYGYHRWFCAETGGAPDHTFTVNGGANLGNQEVGADWGTGGTSTTPHPPSAILLASDHSTPFTFDEILQASDGTDFLYASE